MGDHAFATAMVPAPPARALVITVPLPDDWGRRRVAGGPKIRRFRSHRLELGRRLRGFHALRASRMTVAAVVGTNDGRARASRERELWERASATVVSPIFDDARLLTSPEVLRRRLVRRDGERRAGWLTSMGLATNAAPTRGRIQDAACGLRSPEVTGAPRFGPTRSLLPQ